MDKPMDVLWEFPVRKTKKQKEAFRQAVLDYVRTLGYEAQVEQGGFGARNVVIGDPEQAKFLVTAHYDTCAAMIVPNFSTPCNLPVYLLYQFALVLGMMALSVLAGVAAGLLLDSSAAAGIVGEVVLIGFLLLMLIGPANRSNANDNTSGVAAVLETARALPPQLRQRVCFVLFDLEEAGLLGSSAYRKAHRKAVKGQVVLNLDCVGDGDEIILFPSASVKRDRALLEGLQSRCLREGEKRLYVHTGFGFYPSDQVGFPKGVGIAALKRNKLIGLYLNKIHTRRDTILEEKNIMLLREYLIRVIGAAQPE